MKPEILKQFCSLEIIKNIGSEAVWMYQKAHQIKEMVTITTYEEQV